MPWKGTRSDGEEQEVKKTASLTLLEGRLSVFDSVSIVRNALIAVENLPSSPKNDAMKQKVSYIIQNNAGWNTIKDLSEVIKGAEAAAVPDNLTVCGWLRLRWGEEAKGLEEAQRYGTPDKYGQNKIHASRGTKEKNWATLEHNSRPTQHRNQLRNATKMMTDELDEDNPDHVIRPGADLLKRHETEILENMVEEMPKHRMNSRISKL
ncbi:hypothetical protein ILUMI_02195 [Ignelater luminosus]|uniref:Uncharacterized protein n=1 Tax=Ignelater luminosus TaxID=2038154 RepID=A0A8K0DI47_IGNLU|nr:hypothetical protein ILUMI_02195 [Ignelater luminosus]